MSASLVVDGAVARLTLERPEALNALDQKMAEALEVSLGRLDAMRDVAVLVVSGRGRAFCAGNDITEMPDLDARAAEVVSDRWQRIMDGFGRLPQVTIAAVRGYALGGGCMLALAQDLRVAEASAQFGLPEIGLGFTPSYGIARLFDVLGGAHARDLLLTGRTIDTAVALRMGLVSHVAEDGALDETVATLAAHIAGHPRAALAATKAVISETRAGRPGGEARAYAAALRDPETRARLAAFLARKKRS